MPVYNVLRDNLKLSGEELKHVYKLSQYSSYYLDIQPGVRGTDYDHLIVLILKESNIKAQERLDKILESGEVIAIGLTPVYNCEE